MCTKGSGSSYDLSMVARRQAEVRRRAISSFEQRSYEWLRTREAEGWATRLLRTHRLRVEPVEITTDAMMKIFRAVKAKPDRFDEEKWQSGRADRYCIVIMRHLIVDILRNRKRAPLALLEEADGEYFDPTDELIEDVDVLLNDGASGDWSIGGGDLLDRLRVALEKSDSKPWEVSAALSWFTLSVFPEADIGSAPFPEAGATPQKARLWSGLWYAGERSVFPRDGQGSSAAIRKQRARLMKKVETVMGDAEARIFVQEIS